MIIFERIMKQKEIFPVIDWIRNYGEAFLISDRFPTYLVTRYKKGMKKTGLLPAPLPANKMLDCPPVY